MLVFLNRYLLVVFFPIYPYKSKIATRHRRHWKPGYSRGVKGAPIGIICVLLMGHLVSSQHSVSSSRRKARMESRLSAMYACAFGSKKTPMYSMPDALVRLPLLIPCSLPWLVGIMMIAVPSSTLTKSPDATNQEETSA